MAAREKSSIWLIFFHILHITTTNWFLRQDTEGNFRPERIESIAERFGLGAVVHHIYTQWCIISFAAMNYC
jgi:hypothetical protein